MQFSQDYSHYCDRKFVSYPTTFLSVIPPFIQEIKARQLTIFLAICTISEMGGVSIYGEDLFV